MFRAIKVIALIGAVLSAAACTSMKMNSVVLPDGTTHAAVTATTESFGAPAVTTVTAYRCATGERCSLVDTTKATGASYASSLGAPVVIAAGAVGAAAALRPAEYRNDESTIISNEGSSASSTAKGGKATGGESLSISEGGDADSESASDSYSRSESAADSDSWSESESSSESDADSDSNLYAPTEINVQGCQAGLVCSQDNGEPDDDGKG